MFDMKIAVHPGRILREEYLEPLELSAGRLAKALNVPRTRIERLANEETGVTADTAARLAAAFGTTPQFWLNLQANFDVAMLEPVGDIEPILASG